MPAKKYRLTITPTKEMGKYQDDYDVTLDSIVAVFNITEKSKLQPETVAEDTMKALHLMRICEYEIEEIL